MKNLWRFLLCVIAACLTAGASAAYIGESDDGWDLADPLVRSCEGKDPTGIAMRGCVAAEYRRLDEKLNGAYALLKSDLLEEALLQQSQRAWLKFRDAECTLRVSGMDLEGADTAMVIDRCRIDLTIKRLKDLSHLRSSAGCNGCPVLMRDVR